jgi:hypothetical protein
MTQTPGLGHWDFGFGICFGFRGSGFGFPPLGGARQLVGPGQRAGLVQRREGRDQRVN